MEKVKGFNISELRKKISILHSQRSKLIFGLLHGKPLILGFSYKLYKKCGNKNCKCARGELHGPYPALSVCKAGKQRLIMIRREDRLEITKKAERYNKFQHMLAKIRKIDKEINNLLEEIKTKTTKEYK